MDDTELIKFASMASGFSYSEASSPLVDDALALRLAVKLGIKVEFFHSSNTAFAGPFDMACAEEEADGDSCAATRRAIVRAAAEIGKAMP